MFYPRVFMHNKFITFDNDLDLQSRNSKNLRIELFVINLNYT